MPAINQSATTNRSILALDVGERRVGVAVASLTARLPRPLLTLAYDANFWKALQAQVKAENAVALVVGLPRGLSGQSTAQTDAVEAFTDKLRQRFDLPIYHQDEAMTSHQAESELAQRKKNYDKAEVDALAATYILDDFLNQHRELD